MPRYLIPSFLVEFAFMNPGQTRGKNWRLEADGNNVKFMCLIPLWDAH